MVLYAHNKVKLIGKITVNTIYEEVKIVVKIVVIRKKKHLPESLHHKSTMLVKKLSEWNILLIILDFTSYNVSLKISYVFYYFL